MSRVERNKKKFKIKIVGFIILSLVITGVLAYRTASKNIVQTVQANIENKDAEKNKEAKPEANEDKENKDNKDNKQNEGEKKQDDKPAAQEPVPDGTKVVYLTFDDGPSTTVTPRILEILKKENVKATFFIVGNQAEKSPEILKRVKNDGHAIGNHSYSHNYKYLYASTNNFLADIKKADQAISSIVGEYNKNLIRFPGGSFNRKTFVDATTKAGYHSVDWNCLNGDAEGQHRSKEQLINRFKATCGNQKTLTVLMHDTYGKEKTAEALPEIIKYLKDNGYTFKTLQ